MLCIISRRRDRSTNVYGYIDVDVIDSSGRSVADDEWVRCVGRRVAEECREQYPSPDHIGRGILDEVRERLERRGHEVVIEDE